MSKPTVIDIFCGAGGFSEGFRQQGFDIVMGIDHWEPAIKTFNHNFNLDCVTKNVLDFKESIEQIEALPDTDVILGSPPCVTFSSSNISGKADKTSGITLTQVFLRIVAVKKWKKGSKLKAWFMENVPSSIMHLGKEYTFEELGLADWAIKNKIGKSKVAIKLDGNQVIVNSADYGTAQTRERVISGEIRVRKKLVIPEKTHRGPKDPVDAKLPWRTLHSIKGKLPKPSCSYSSRLTTDPNYPALSIPLNQLTDHFYDTGLYECEWKQSMFLKTNHPYMGKMSFPENDEKPSRTVTATKIGISREALIYRSTFDRVGDGEYRTGTIREAACIMGFPITYQFLGGETTKWRLVGNAVCPGVSRSFAKQLRKELGLSAVKDLCITTDVNLAGINNLNTFTEKVFNNPPKKNSGCRFRRHPFKDGNLTVTLSNYDVSKNGKTIDKWRTSVQYGSGEGFPTYNYPDGYFKELEKLINALPKGKPFIEVINNGFSEKVAKAVTLQEMYELQRSKAPYLNPIDLVDKIASIINSLKIDNEVFEQKHIRVFRKKETVPVKQLFALYAINKITSIANQ